MSSRAKKSFFNAGAAATELLLKSFLRFVVRTFFIRSLGKEFLGLDGLYTNILSMLSLTELGLSSAIIFSMYKPLAKHDEKKIRALMHIYKKCYLLVGCAIFILSLAITPFLQNIINSDFSFGNVYLIFGLYTLKTLSTYWVLAYKESILIANQQKYKLIKPITVSMLVDFILQTISLLVYKSIELYVLSSVVATILRNLYIAHIANKSFPYIKTYSGEKIEKNEKNELIKNVFGASLYRVSSTVMNSTDNIIISAFISIVTTGIYSNYLLIVSNIKLALDSVFSSFTSSVGNLHTENDKEKSKFIFNCLCLLSFWIYGYASICLWELLNPFITIWAGPDYLFAKTIVFVIVLNFITDGLQRPVLIYKDACGLFWKGKLRPVFSAISNIIISLLLVGPLGITGVILGSIASRMLTTWWFDPKLVYQNVFKSSPIPYYLRYFRSLFIIIAVGFIVDSILFFIPIEGILGLIVRLLVSTVVANLMFWIIFRKSEEYGYFKGKVMSRIRKK